MQALIENIYAAGMGEQPWRCALDRIRALTGTRLVAIVTLDGAGQTLASDVAADDDELAGKIQQGYNDEFHRYDPSRAVAAEWDVGRWYDDRQWNRDRQRSHSIYHQEFLRPLDLGYWEGAFVSRTTRLSHFLSLHGGTDDMGSTSSRDSFQSIGTHLGRALRLQAQLASSQQQVNHVESVFDALGCAIFVLDDSRRLLRANSAASRLMAREKALRFVNGRFEPSPPSPSTAREWHEACRQGAIALRRPAPHSPLVLRLTPLSASSAVAKDWQRPLTLMVASGDRSIAERQSSLRIVFGLTQAESEVCTSICVEGLTPQACAESRGVSIGTIRSQIKSIHLKTGVTRLAELVRLVTGM